MILSRRFGPAGSSDMMMDTSSGYLKWLLQVGRKGREGKGREGTENERWMYGIAAGISFTVIDNAATLWNRNLISYLQMSFSLPGVQLIPKFQTKQLCICCWWYLVRATHCYTESHHSSAGYCIHKASHSHPRGPAFRRHHVAVSSFQHARASCKRSYLRCSCSRIIRETCCTGRHRKVKQPPDPQ